MDRIESLLFNYGTTNRSDIRPIDPRELDKVYLKPIKDVTKASRVKEEQTNIQDKKTQTQFEQIHPSRERIVMAPAVNIDNVLDAHVRQIIIKDMYTSSIQRAYSYEPIYHDVRAPLPDRYTRSNPLALPKGFTPYVSAEWRAQSMEWDKKQSRSHCDASKVFWSTS